MTADSVWAGAPPRVEGRVRRATEVDARELLRLRAVMLTSMGRHAGPADAPWRERGVAVLEARLTDTDRFAAFVIDAPGEQLVACAVAWLDRHLPGPDSPDGESGYLANVCTDPAYRRQGLGRLVVTAADAWLGTTGTARAYLAASPDGEQLYRSLGWTDTTFPHLVRRYRG